MPFANPVLPSAVVVSSWSAAGGRGYTRWRVCENIGPMFFTKRVRCSRGRTPAV